MNTHARNLSQKSLVIDQETIHPSSPNPLASHKFILFCSNHLSALLASAGRLKRTPLTTLITITIIGIALALPASLLLSLANIKQLGANWHDNSAISLYLKANVSANQAQALINQIKKQSGITSVKYISPAAGLAELQNQTDLQNIIAALNQNPLPGVILVEPNSSQTPEKLNRILQNLQQLPTVDMAQFDMQWVKKLAAIVDLAKDVTYALGVLLGAGVLFIIGNIIHLNLQKYQQEIEVYKLIGATDGFIRRPFLYTGILYGFFGSLWALVLIGLLLLGVVTPVHKLVSLYNSNFQLQGIGISLVFSLVFTGILLGLIGAWLAVGKHLRAI